MVVQPVILFSGVGEHIIGIDVDSHALRIAAERGFTVCYTDINKGLGFADQSFAAVNCSAVLEHVHDPLALMRENSTGIKAGR